MAWPFKEPTPTTPNPEAGAAATTAKEPTQAEIIADSIAAALRPVTESISALSNRVNEVAEQTRRPAPAQEPVQTASVFDDENAAFAQRMTPLLQNQLVLSAKLAKDEVRREYERKGFADVWAQFEGEIDRWLENSPLVNAEGKEVRGSKDYIRNTVDMIFGRAAVAAGVRFDGKRSQFFLEGAGGGVEGTNSQPVSDGLTQAQRDAARKWGISPDAMKAAKDKLVVVQ